MKLPVFALPPSEKIRQTAQEVLARPEFTVDNTPSSSELPWGLAILRWLLRFFERLFDRLEGLPEFMRWGIVILAVAVLLAIVAHLIYSLVRAVRGSRPANYHPTSTAAQELDSAALELCAKEAAEAGDYSGAIRFLFRASLRQIETKERKKFRPGLTNRELLGRYRSSSLFDSLAKFAQTIDWKWYGGGICELSDYTDCRAEHARICEICQKSKPFSPRAT